MIDNLDPIKTYYSFAFIHDRVIVYWVDYDVVDRTKNEYEGTPRSFELTPVQARCVRDILDRQNETIQQQLHHYVRERETPPGNED